jgi:hypothetical protein
VSSLHIWDRGTDISHPLAASYGRTCRRCTCRPGERPSVGTQDLKHNRDIAPFLSFFLCISWPEVLRRRLGSALGLVNGPFVSNRGTVRVQHSTPRILSKVWFYPMGNQAHAALANLVPDRPASSGQRCSKRQQRRLRRMLPAQALHYRRA